MRYCAFSLCPGSKVWHAILPNSYTPTWEHWGIHPNTLLGKTSEHVHILVSATLARALSENQSWPGLHIRAKCINALSEVRRISRAAPGLVWAECACRQARYPE